MRPNAILHAQGCQGRRVWAKKALPQKDSVDPRISWCEVLERGMNKKRERAQCIKICKVSSTSSTDAQAQVYVHVEQKRNRVAQ